MHGASRIPVFQNGKNPAKNWKGYSPRGTVSAHRSLNKSLSTGDVGSTSRGRNNPRTLSPKQAATVGQEKHITYKSEQHKLGNATTKDVSAGKHNTDRIYSQRGDERKPRNGNSPRTPSPQHGNRPEYGSDSSIPKYTRSRSASPGDSVSKIPRFGAARDRSPSPGRHKVERVHALQNKSQKEETHVDDEDEFVRLEKMFAEEENGLRSNTNEKNSKQGKENYVVEEITEEVHEAPQSREHGSVITYTLGKESKLSRDENLVSYKRSLPCSPSQPVSKDNLTTNNSSTEKDNYLPIKESINSNGYHTEILKTGESNIYSTQQDNSANCIKRDNKIREGNLTDKGSPKNERLMYSRKEFTTDDNKETHYVIEDGIQDQSIEFNTADSSRQTGFKDKITNTSDTSTISNSKHKAKDLRISTQDHVSNNTVAEKGNSGYRVLEDVYELNDVMKMPRYHIEADLNFPNDKELPSYNGVPDVGTVDYYAYDELRYGDEDEDTPDNMGLGSEDKIHGSSVFGKRSKKWDFPSHFLEDGALLTDIEEENTADLLQYSSIRSHLIDTDDGRDIDWEEETLPPDSKRGSFDSISFPISSKSKHGTEDQKEVGLSIPEKGNTWSEHSVSTNIITNQVIDKVDNTSKDFESVVSEPSLSGETKIGRPISTVRNLPQVPHHTLTHSESFTDKTKNVRIPGTGDSQREISVGTSAIRNRLIEKLNIITEYSQKGTYGTGASSVTQKGAQSPRQSRNLPKVPLSNEVVKDKRSSDQVEILYTSLPFKLSETLDKTPTALHPRPNNVVANELKGSYGAKTTEKNLTTKYVKDNNENISYSVVSGNYDIIEEKTSSYSTNGFEPITIGTIRPSDEDDMELKLSSKHSLAFGEMNPIKIECVKLCRSKSLKSDQDETIVEYETINNLSSGELEDVKVELKKMNNNISGLQKELHSAKQKVIRLRSGLAMIRENRLLWKRYIQRKTS